MPRARAPAFWYGRARIPLWARTLEPVYRLLRALRRAPYALRVRHPWRAPVPVIVVGNVTAGGSGKTPLVLALVEALRAGGWRPGVVSRGYGRTDRTAQRVVAGSRVDKVGDEPLLIQRASGAPVAVAVRRADAARLLLVQGVDVIVADDGLQHLALARDIEIVVVDGVHRFGNGHLLPAGPLRDPPARMRDADFVVCNGGVPQPGEWSMHLRSGSPRALLRTDTPAPQPGAEVHGVAGIGDPARFFAALRALGYRVREHAFADHHAYVQADFGFDEGTLPIVMTEKDAVKCAAFAQPHWWALPACAELPADFFSAVLARLPAARRASRGHAG